MAAHVAVVIRGVEDFFLSLMKGLSCNIDVVIRLLENRDDRPISPPQEKPKMTELARRRAEKNREKQKEDAPPENPRGKKKTVRGMILFMIKTNCVFSFMFLIGMTQVILPVMSWAFGDLWKSHTMLEQVVGTILMGMWMIPLTIITKLANTFWMNDLSVLAYRETLGNPVQSEMPRFVSDLLYSTIVQLIFLVQIALFSFIPLILCGFSILEVVLSAISYSMYAFEYKWMNMGYEVRKRLDLVDRNFAFHFGFGLPVTMATLYFESFWARLILNSFFFPTLILAANYAAEPREVKGNRKTYVFYLSEKATEYFFKHLQKFGLKATIMLLLSLLGLLVLYWVGVLSVLFHACALLGGYLLQACQNLVESFRS